MLHLLFAFVSSVLQCDADPTGQKDSTAAFRACLDQHPSGDLLIPTGTYKISGTVSLNRNQGLTGMGAKASVIKCLSASLACVVIGDATGGPNNYSITNIQNLGIEGPGTNNKSIGIHLGGDPNGTLAPKNVFADNVNLIGVRITGFHHGVQWGNNAYVDKIVRSSIFANDVALYAPPSLTNSGEAIGITDSAIFNNTHAGIEDHSNFEWMVQGSSFDYNTTAIQFYGAHIHIANCHFEQNAGQVFFQPSGWADLSIRDSTILIQAATGSDKYILSSWPQSLHLVIDDVSVWSNHPIQYFMHMQGSVSGSVTNFYGNGNGKISAFSESSKTPELPPSVF